MYVTLSRIRIIWIKPPAIYCSCSLQTYIKHDNINTSFINIIYMTFGR